MRKTGSWQRLTALCIVLTISLLAESESSLREPRVVEMAREKDLYDPRIPEESIYSTLDLSTAKKIDLIRYYLAPKIPGESIAVLVDTAEPFYETIKQLWKAVFTTDGDETGANILIFAYNDTDCSLVPRLPNNGNVAVSQALELIPATEPTSEIAKMIFECLNFATSIIGNDSSVTVFTGRIAGDGPSFGERTALGLIGKRCKLNGIWCDGDVVNDYERIVYRTEGIFVRFSGPDHRDSGSGNNGGSEGEESSLASSSNTTSGNARDSQTVTEGGNLSYRTDDNNREDESADLINYDRKISGKLERVDSGRILTLDEVEIESRETPGLDGAKLSSLTAVESALRLEDTSIEVAAETSLVGRPGSVSRLTFRVTNNYPLTIRHYFQAKSTSFNIVYLQPRNAWIEAGQTMNVVADILVPSMATESMTETVTLTVQGIGSVEKSTYIYVRRTGSTISDANKPTITHSFNSNCAEKSGSTVCARNIWSVDITVQDSDSGLQRVTSSPRGIRATTTFVSGTKSSTSFQYAATCCQTSVAITAEDLLGNSNSLTIDVNVWNNLSWSQIAAIILGSLLFLLLIIAIIATIIFFVLKRKKSQDLPFTQRYGTRPKRAERTSF